MKAQHCFSCKHFAYDDDLCPITKSRVTGMWYSHICTVDGPEEAPRLLEVSGTYTSGYGKYCRETDYGKNCGKFEKGTHPSRPAIDQTGSIFFLSLMGLFTIAGAVIGYFEAPAGHFFGTISGGFLGFICAGFLMAFANPVVFEDKPKPRDGWSPWDAHHERELNND